MAEELLRRMAALEARVHAGGAASRRLVELEEDVHRYYSAFLELDGVLGRMAAAQRGLAAGVEALQAQQAQQARGAREAERAAREARAAERAARAALPSPLEARLAGFEARLAGLEARGALGARRLAELEDTTDRYYNVFLEVDIVVERVVASQHALVESVLALRAGSGPRGAPGPSGAPAAGSGSSGAPGPSGAPGASGAAGPSGGPAASGGGGEVSSGGAGAAGAAGGGDAPGAVPQQRVAWRGKMCLHGRRGYRCKLCNGS
jgi:hypothetical protein